MEENIKKPKHYKLNGLEIESIDIVKAVSSEYEGVNAFYIGNILKYLIRSKKKNGLEDLKKSRVYLNWLIEEIEIEV